MKGNDKMYGLIYKIQNNMNSKVYIGQTINNNGFNGRYSYNLEENTHNEHLKRAILKYGIENFEITKEFDVAYSQEELNEKEIYWIEYYNSTDSNFGYNKRDGGNGGSLSVESKNKISKTKQSNRDTITKILINNMKLYGRNKFYSFDIKNYDTNEYIDIPLSLLLRNNNFDELILNVICYLYINTNRLGYCVFNLKDMMNFCGFENHNTRTVSRFKKTISKLEEYDYIDSEVDMETLNINTIIRFKLNIDNNNSEEFVAINLKDICNIMNLETKDDKQKLFKVYIYLIYLSNQPINIINGIENIKDKLDIHKETLMKYINILTENRFIYSYDLGWIKTSKGTIRGGTCYARTNEDLENIKNNCEYIDLEKYEDNNENKI
jgi:hypothetical protein